MENQIVSMTMPEKLGRLAMLLAQSRGMSRSALVRELLIREIEDSRGEMNAAIERLRGEVQNAST